MVLFGPQPSKNWKCSSSGCFPIQTMAPTKKTPMTPVLKRGRPQEISPTLEARTELDSSIVFINRVWKDLAGLERMVPEDKISLTEEYFTRIRDDLTMAREQIDLYQKRTEKNEQLQEELNDININMTSELNKRLKNLEDTVEDKNKIITSLHDKLAAQEITPNILQTYSSVVSNSRGEPFPKRIQVMAMKQQSETSRYQLLVTHSSLNPSTALDTVEKSLVSMTAQQVQARKTARGVILNCSSPAILEEVMKKVQSQKDVTMKEPSKLSPRIKVVAIPMNLEDEQSKMRFITEIKGSNTHIFREHDPVITRIQKRKDGNVVILEISSSDYLSIMAEDRPRLYYRLQSLRVFEDDDILECFNCLEVGHTKSNCSRCTNCKKSHRGQCREEQPTLICFRCGGNHHAKQCTEEYPSCFLCRRLGGIDPYHRRLSPDCEVRRRALERKITMTNLVDAIPQPRRETSSRISSAPMHVDSQSITPQGASS